MKTNKILLAALLVACGGSQKTGLGGGKDVPPPPPNIGNGGGGGDDGGGKAPKEPVRELSKSAKEDYKSAYDAFLANDKQGWSEGACRSSADKFGAVIRSHPELVEAQFMVGLSYQRCNMMSEAEKAYQDGSRMKGEKAALSVSSLGSIYFKAGKIDGAKQYWETAIKAFPKLVGAHIGMATLELEQMRKINNPKDPTWKKLDDDARFHLSNALGVDTDSVEAYTQFGFIWMEGWQQNKSRLDLAKTLLDEGKKRLEAGANGGKYAPLHNAYGLYYMHRNLLNQALTEFQAAVADDPRFVEARKNVGFVTISFRRYDTAKEMFSKALEISPKDYDAIIGLGIAQRGVNEIDNAEASFKKARDLDGSRGPAYFNLGVLYKAFKASKQTDLKQSIAITKQAKEFFQQFLGKSTDKADLEEAKNNIADCDKLVASLTKFMEQQAKNPPPAPTPPPANP
jgi:tetratricopeptide (TPR) repeat protein